MPIHLSSSSSRSRPLLVQAPSSFTDSTGDLFTSLLATANEQARQLEEEGVLSLAIPLASGDPMRLLPHLEPEDEQLAPGGDSFRFLWDGAPGLCIAAAGRTNSL